ncbi:hypothetical protein PsYK624_002280 [Phanerochaete sordida]|uniref:MYND-type domain-containing protein n=1 Tax=Phanerochaete sordida TaxID=48140 RepID=A0A9P3FX62_9APHY|nr:hypothetical protein PsYK624_002280 [Phanerochaete sordida]
MSDAVTPAIPSLWGAKEWQHAVFYLHTRIWCYFSAIEGAEILDVEEAAVDDVRRLQERSTEAVRAGATAGNAHDKLELALRQFTGVGTAHDVLGALDTLNSGTLDPDTIPRFVRVRALSLLARIFFDQSRVEETKDVAQWNFGNIYRAAVLVDEAAALGFVSAMVLQVGVAIERNGFRRPEDPRDERVADAAAMFMPGFTSLIHLWRAVDRRKAQMVRDLEGRTDALPKDPNAYICAAPGCGIESTPRETLRRCSGKCAPAGKPAYCDRICQKKDWLRHKHFCGEHAPIDGHAASMHQAAYEAPAFMNFADVDSYWHLYEAHFEAAAEDHGPEDPHSQIPSNRQSDSTAQGGSCKICRPLPGTPCDGYMKRLKELLNEALACEKL